MSRQRGQDRFALQSAADLKHFRLDLNNPPAIQDSPARMEQVESRFVSSQRESPRRNED